MFLRSASLIMAFFLMLAVGTGSGILSGELSGITPIAEAGNTSGQIDAVI